MLWFILLSMKSVSPPQVCEIHHWCCRQKKVAQLSRSDQAKVRNRKIFERTMSFWFTLLLFSFVSKSCIIGLSSKQILKEQSWRSSLTWWESCEYPFFCTRFLNNCNYTANILCGAFIHKHKNENYTARHKHNHEVLQSWSRISIMTMKNIIHDINQNQNAFQPSFKIKFRL